MGFPRGGLDLIGMEPTEGNDLEASSEVHLTVLWNAWIQPGDLVGSDRLRSALNNRLTPGLREDLAVDVARLAVSANREGIRPGRKSGSDDLKDVSLGDISGSSVTC